MKVRVRISGLPAGSCFVSGKTVKKKLADGTVLTVDKKGRIRKRAQKGDPSVRPTSCPLRYIGAGMLKHPESVVEIGDGRPRKVTRRRLR